MSAEGAARRPREARLLAAISIFAALRVMIFAAAFPFFTNVDEHRHVDMAVKYARGYVPHPDDATYEPITIVLLADLASPDYASPPGRPIPPPTWSLSEAERARRVALQERRFGRAVNLEAFQSPVYYAAAGTALGLLRGAGLEWGTALYGVRALNGVALALLVWVAWALLRRTHPKSALVRLGVPVLLAAMPLDALFYVTGDALAPLAGGLAFTALVACAVRGPGPAAFAAAGLAIALAVLTKATNVVLVGLALLATPLLLREAGRRAAYLRIGALWLALALPLGLWMLRSLALTGSALGTAPKVERLGWGVRGIGEWWGHPLLSVSGMLDFLSGLVPSFWRGEVVWQRTVLAWAPADLFYTGSTILLLALAAVGLREHDRPVAQRTEGAAVLTVAGAVAVLALLSLRFVFSDTTNPTADRPWFTQGRLVSGAWLPFAILYVRGIEVATRRFGPAAGWALLLLVTLLCVGSEIALSRPVFASPYNFYHLP